MKRHSSKQHSDLSNSRYLLDSIFFLCKRALLSCSKTPPSVPVTEFMYLFQGKKCTIYLYIHFVLEKL